MLYTAYRHLIPNEVDIKSAQQDPQKFRDSVELDWLLWRKNIDPSKIIETGLICS